MRKIEDGMDMQEILWQMSEGNQGALTVCLDILKKGAKIDPDDFAKGLGTILSLDANGIYGCRIWQLYKDVCKEDLSMTMGVVRANRLGYLAGVTNEALAHAIDNRGDGIDLAEVRKAVTERLPNFTFFTKYAFPGMFKRMFAARVAKWITAKKAS